MEIFRFLITFSLIFSLSTSRAARTIFNTPSQSRRTILATSASNFTKICDPNRYNSLGLDISAFSFCDDSLPYDVRAKDLVNSMTINEKVQQLGNMAQGVARLGLPPYEWWSEALHGVSNVGPGTKFDKASVPGATSFPTPILAAASFNESLWKATGQVVSTEARAMHNLGLAGLTFWSPNINVVRDPRWGRALETPGEDPFVVGSYAANYVRGLQDVEGHENTEDLNSRPLKVSSCCKHYAAYDVDNWEGVDRYHFNARVTAQDMKETFMRPFEMCVKEGDVSSVMCSYNRVNGIPACADPHLLSGTIRGDWNLHGYIVSDCDSIEVMLHGHKWLKDALEDAVSQALKAGLDLDCGKYYPEKGVAAIKEGKVAEAEVDKALKNLYIVLMRLGLFDGSPNPSYASLGKDDVCTKENIELATESARQGIVLLKNEATLPLSQAKYKNLAVIGPHANATDAMIGNYAGIPCGIISPLKGLSMMAKVEYSMGCDGVQCRNDTFIFDATEVAKLTDATIIFAGLDLSAEAESLDRTDLLLPGYQTKLIKDVARASRGPVILIILSAGGVDIDIAVKDSKIGAILWAGYPGERGGLAIAEAIYGHFSPGGRLPLTWYFQDYVDKVPMTSMRMRPVDELGYPGRTYKFFNGSTLFPFGYGLSYTQFTTTLLQSAQRSLPLKLSPMQHCHNIISESGEYLPPCPAIRVSDLRNSSATIDFDLQVKNTGPMDGSHVLMVYAVPPTEYSGLPIKQLVGFKRVYIAAGATETVKFSLDLVKTLAVVTDTAYTVLPYGEHTIQIGDRDEAVSFPFNVAFNY